MAGLKLGPARKVADTSTGYRIWYRRGYGPKSKAVMLPGIYASGQRANSGIFYVLRKQLRPAGIHYMVPVGYDPNSKCALPWGSWAHFG